MYIIETIFLMGSVNYAVLSSISSEKALGLGAALAWGNHPRPLALVSTAGERKSGGQGQMARALRRSLAAFDRYTGRVGAGAGLAPRHVAASRWGRPRRGTSWAGRGGAPPATQAAAEPAVHPVWRSPRSAHGSAMMPHAAGVQVKQVIFHFLRRAPRPLMSAAAALQAGPPARPPGHACVVE